MSQFVVENRTLLKDFAKKYNLKYLAVFGSQARGDTKDSSDVDLLVEYPKRTSLFDVVRMERDLGSKLKRPVDLVSRKYLSKHISPYVNQDLVIIHDQR
jgi:uncharacterized protein